jgi:hypothetical protein
MAPSKKEQFIGLKRPPPDRDRAGAEEQSLMSSVISGVINEYDANGGFVRTILQPCRRTLGETTFDRRRWGSASAPTARCTTPISGSRSQRGHRSGPEGRCAGSDSSTASRSRRNDGRRPRVPGRHRRVRAEEAVTN